MGGHFEGDVGLRVTDVGMRWPYVYLEEPPIDPRETGFCQVYNALFPPELTLGRYALSAGFISPSPVSEDPS